MKDFPLNELLSATDLDKIQESLVLIFGHINRKLNPSPPVEVISRDFNHQLLRVLTSHRLPYTHPTRPSIDSSPNLPTSSERWTTSFKEFTNVAREATRQEKSIPIKVVPAHAKLQERTRYLRDWRKQHGQLAVMAGPTKGLGARLEWKMGDGYGGR